MISRLTSLLALCGILLGKIEGVLPPPLVPPYPPALPPTAIPLAQTADEIVGAGWLQVNFGQVGTISNPYLAFNSTSHLLLRVTDAFVAGDAFNVIINGQFAFQTPPVDFNASVIATEPDLAYGNWQFSWASIRLLPGAYTVQIIPYQSPLVSGSAFMRVDTVLQQCESDIYTILQIPGANYTSAQSETVCASYGLVLANPRPYEYERLGNAMIECLGHNSAVWVQSRNLRDAPSNGFTCLAAFVKDSNTTTMVNVPTSCLNITYPVLCVNPIF